MTVASLTTDSSKTWLSHVAGSLLKEYSKDELSSTLEEDGLALLLLLLEDFEEDAAEEFEDVFEEDSKDDKDDASLEVSE